MSGHPRSARAFASRKPLAAVLASAALFVFTSAGVASAHVTIGPDTTAKGGSDVELTFRVPNEEASATTTQLEVVLPTDHPITGVLPEPTPGWQVAVTNTTLPKPVTTDDGTVTQVVSELTWTGGALAPGQYQGFRVMLGKLPDDTNQLVFKAVQTYSNGDVVRWIDLAQPGQPAPDHPAPVLVLTGSGAGSQTSGASVTTGPATPSSAIPSSAIPSSATGDSTARTLGTVGIVVGAAGLAVGAFGMSRARRKSSDSHDTPRE
ncbi:YcnI family protein [Catenulispora sp. NF23]|uniref:YcnI family copper-binding membrane protein n=1 Tax=Catenulispora pinistramenti TaxID=2705254 RepID=UPI001BAE2766|nr:YcnI family protein [Catenulispora pinistramenti]MBS2539948.1 YcnI family protein [Catenulispora pinistramenti]